MNQYKSYDNCRGGHNFKLKEQIKSIRGDGGGVVETAMAASTGIMSVNMREGDRTVQ